MEQLINKLCLLNGTSGSEEKVREFIINTVKDHCEVKQDRNGNLICYKKGRFSTDKTIMVDAHMDEVGFIVTGYTADGFLKFSSVGGVEPSVAIARRIVFQNGKKGVICAKPIHMLKGDEKSKIPEIEDMFIDIGAVSEAQAEQLVPLGTTAVFESEFLINENNIFSKALDDRVGVAVLIKMLVNDALCDFYGVFSWGEEIGCRGAKTAAYSLNPDYAIVLETTTAADIEGVAKENTVCSLNNGVAISFMDRGTLYDKQLFDTAKAVAERNNITYQIKSAVAGGNNAAAIHLSRDGVKTITLSVPCRYIHSGVSVCNYNDVVSQYLLANALLKEIG